MPTILARKLYKIWELWERNQTFVIFNRFVENLNHRLWTLKLWRNPNLSTSFQPQLLKKSEDRETTTTKIFFGSPKFSISKIFVYSIPFRPPPPTMLSITTPRIEHQKLIIANTVNELSVLNLGKEKRETHMINMHLNQRLEHHKFRKLEKRFFGLRTSNGSKIA